jgi:hypothetical protein
MKANQMVEKWVVRSVVEKGILWVERMECQPVVKTVGWKVDQWVEKKDDWQAVKSVESMVGRWAVCSVVEKEILWVDQLEYQLVAKSVAWKVVH